MNLICTKLYVESNMIPHFLQTSNQLQVKQPTMLVKIYEWIMHQKNYQ